MTAIRDEADRLGIPNEILMSSILHRFASGELVDRKELLITLKEKTSSINSIEPRKLFGPMAQYALTKSFL